MKRGTYSIVEDGFIRKNPDMSNSEVGRHLGRKGSSVYRYRKRNQLAMPPSETGKGLGTQLAKIGNQRASGKPNWRKMPVHTIRTQRRRGADIPFIKLGEKQWMPYRKYVWEQHFGPLPAGRVVRVKNGDESDVRPENLELITRRELSRANINTAGRLATLRKNRRAVEVFRRYGLVHSKDRKARKEAA